MNKLLIAAATLALSGCSALQVDVDVYKGPLLHTPEVQQRQFAYMAISARPMIERLKVAAEHRLAECKGGCPDPEAREAAVRFSNEILGMYTGATLERNDVTRGDKGGGRGGIDALTKQLAAAYAAKPGDGRNAEVRIALAALNEVLVLFAQRVLFVVNNENLFAALGGEEGDVVKSQKAVLQSLANTLLVHLNDLGRQDERERAQNRRATVEAAAVQRANGIAASVTPGTQMEVIDELIADLRARRVRALAAGEATKADDLQAAINAAYEQRTAMIYLRPASDYLLSVHSASALQDASEPQYRNMLNDWFRYMNPLRSDEDKEATSRLELEKLYWQNINRVTLGGGGFTNFVLAKDDVGNWYVKAYSSDPEAIFKSAFNLALFNAGSRLNLNLLHRQGLQEKLDASSDDAERARLAGQLDSIDNQDGRPLLVLRSRHALRYERATVADGEAVERALDELPSQARTAIDRALAAGAGGAGTCPADTVKARLVPAEAPLAGPRDRLKTLRDKPDSVAGGQLAVEYERATFRALDGIDSFARAAPRAVQEPGLNGCSPEQLAAGAKAVRAVAREALVSLARQRRETIDRYEEALTAITEVAAQRP